MLASATTPAGGMPWSCIDHAMPNVPAEPALPPWRNVLVVGYSACANWIAAFVASMPLVGRGLPSGVVFGLFGSGVFTPP